jgi:hypothetical protein
MIGGERTSTVNSDLESFLLQLTSVSQDLPGIAHGLTEAQFNWQPGSDRWSIGQNIEHLNLTTERYIPVLTTAIGGARAAGRISPGPFALGLVERWLLAAMEPPPRRRFRTRPAFVATALLSPDVTVRRFLSLQEQFAGAVRSADRLDLRRIKVRSQFGPVSWSLTGTFAILIAHQRRHVWQARQVRREPAFPAE